MMAVVWSSPRRRVAPAPVTRWRRLRVPRVGRPSLPLDGRRDFYESMSALKRINGRRLE